MNIEFEGRVVPIESLSREELLRYGKQGRYEDLDAARELCIRHRRRMGERSLWDAPNVVSFPSRRRLNTTDHGGVA